jgi:hypothetical protein
MVQNRFLIFFVMAFLLSSCKIDRKHAIDRDKITFRVAEDNLLFFKNVRQIYYDFQDLPEANWYAYRFGDRPIDPKRPILIPVIVVDWMKSEAYVLVEPNEVLQNESEFVVRERNKRGIIFEYSLKERGRENMLEFATKIYEGIMQENDIFVVSQGKEVSLFTNKEEMETFRIVMSDYYRLTRIF